MLITQRVENSSLADPKVSMTSGVQVAYGTDLDALMPQLAAAMAAVPRVLAEPAPAVQLESFGADGMNLVLVFWIDDPHNGQGNVKSDVNLAVLRCLNAIGRRDSVSAAGGARRGGCWRRGVGAGTDDAAASVGAGIAGVSSPRRAGR